MNWFGSVAIWVIDQGVGKWGYAVVDAATLLYFLRQWTAPHGQHRTFHFILMATHLSSVAFSAFQILFHDVFPKVVVFSARWWQFLDNNIFVLELLGVSVYGLLYRRAHANAAKWQADTEEWLDKIRKAEKADEDESEDA